MPGSHHRRATEEETAAGAYPFEGDMPGEMPVQLEPGDVVLRHPNLIHRGFNPEGISRWTIIADFSG